MTPSSASPPSPSSARSRCEQAVGMAQQLEPSPEVCAQGVTRALRRAALHRPTLDHRLHRWQLIAACSWVGAAAALVLLVLPARIRSPAPDTRSGALADRVEQSAAAPAPIDPNTFVGRRVVVRAEARGRFVVERAHDDLTTIEVTEGTVAARLLPGPSPHRLQLVAGDLVAEATGTVFSVSLVGGEPSVSVLEGRVHVTRSELSYDVEAGTTYESGAILPTGTPSTAELALAELPATAPAATSVPREQSAGSAPSPAASLLRTAPADATPAPAPAPAQPIVSKPESPLDLWRRARLLRGQARYNEAVTTLRELAARSDPTWAPIALAEVSRIELDVLGDAPAALEVATDFLIRFGDHTLALEVHEIARRACKSLGEARAGWAQCADLP